jgi:hypothetical protein
MIIASLKEVLPVSSTMQLRHPRSGEYLFVAENEPLTVTLVGPDSIEVFNEHLAAKRRRAEAGDKAEEVEFVIEEEAGIVIAAIKSWSHDEFFGGKPSKKTITAFVKDHANAVLVEQIKAHLLERTNFFS